MTQGEGPITDVRSILFRLKLKGSGIVNFDSSEQKFIWNSYNRNGEFVRHDNVQFGKHRYTEVAKTEDGKVIADRKMALSHDCLRHTAFVNDFPYQSPNIIADPALLNRMIGDPASILRGYLLNQKGEIALKRTSPLRITDAIQSNGAISTLDTCSRSGKKESSDNKTESDVSDNSMFKRESVGNITYECLGCLDLNSLQFISMDDLFDRMAVNSDDFEAMYKPTLQKAFDRLKTDPVGTPDYYSLIESCVKLPEYGLLLTDSQQVVLAMECFKKILCLQLIKNSGYVTVESLEIKYVVDPLRDRLLSDSGWIALTDPSELNFKPFRFYEEAPKEDRTRFEEKVAKQLASARNLREDEKKRKEEAKAKKKGK